MSVFEKPQPVIEEPPQPNMNHPKLLEALKKQAWLLRQMEQPTTPYMQKLCFQIASYGREAEITRAEREVWYWSQAPHQIACDFWEMINMHSVAKVEKVYNPRDTLYILRIDEHYYALFERKYTRKEGMWLTAWGHTTVTDYEFLYPIPERYIRYSPAKEVVAEYELSAPSDEMKALWEVTTETINADYHAFPHWGRLGYTPE